MANLKWCLTHKDGIRLVDPSQNLASAYVKKAEDSLVSMNETSIRDWKISTAYYTMYFSLYAILNRVGIKCELHGCTIEFAHSFLKEYFTDEEIEFLEDSMGARVDSQYYTDRKIDNKRYESMIKRAPEFLVKCKEVVNKLNEKKINEIRDKLKSEISKIDSNKAKK